MQIKERGGEGEKLKKRRRGWREGGKVKFQS